MMTVLIFLGALSVGMASFELLDSLLEHSRMPGRLQGIRAENPVESARRSTLSRVMVFLMSKKVSSSRSAVMSIKNSSRSPSGSRIGPTMRSS